VYRLLLEKPEERSQLGRAKHRWEDYIQMDLKQDGQECPGLIWLRTGKIGQLA
jgi:hypothetical protein